MSPRTIQRWIAHRSSPVTTQQLTIARALYPLDPELAAQFAQAGGETLESLGLAPRRLLAAAKVSVPLRRAVDAVVYAAAEAGELPARAARQAVLAALRCMIDTGLAVETALGAFEQEEPTPAPKRRAAARRG